MGYAHNISLHKTVLILVACLLLLGEDANARGPNLYDRMTQGTLYKDKGYSTSGYYRNGRFNTPYNTRSYYFDSYNPKYPHLYPRALEHPYYYKQQFGYPYYEGKGEQGSSNVSEPSKKSSNQ